MKLSRGTEPSGRHPPLMRQPAAPFSFSFVQTLKSSSGLGAETIVSNTLPLQCWHFRAQEEPVIEIEGKESCDEWKYLFL